jgi:hypothetical protein
MALPFKKLIQLSGPFRQHEGNEGKVKSNVRVCILDDNQKLGMKIFNIYFPLFSLLPFLLLVLIFININITVPYHHWLHKLNPYHCDYW